MEGSHGGFAETEERSALWIHKPCRKDRTFHRRSLPPTKSPSFINTQLTMGCCGQPVKVGCAPIGVAADVIEPGGLLLVGMVVVGVGNVGV